MPAPRRTISALTLLLLIAQAPTAAEVGERVERVGDEIMVCGQLFHTTAPVVLWTDPGGYDAYRVERRFAPWEKASWAATQAEAPLDTPNRYNLRNKDVLTPEQIERVRGGGWTLEQLQGVVDQFVMHFDVCGFSKLCFKVLHDSRCLSVHFMIDVDGTIYQTLDLKERAWHATTSNSRSIGVEIAHIGAYSAKGRSKLDEWYTRDADGRVRMSPPDAFLKRLGGSGVRTANFVARPARNELIVGEIQSTELYQYDFTPEQYDSLTKLTATLCRVFPKLTCQYPQDESGRVIPHKLPDAQLREYQGVLAHYHVQTNKTDPGPAFDWDRVVGGARELLEGSR